MKIPPFFRMILIVLVCGLCRSAAQQTPTAQAATTTMSAVPNVVNYSGVLTDLNGKPLSGIQGVTFLLYSSEQGGNPLWMETQNITPARNGRYTVTLGSTTAQGLPSDIFSSGEARWLAVQVAGQPEQPRVLLVAVPYALKAGDSETLGGLPASAFMLAAPANAANNAGSAAGSAANGNDAPPAASNTSSDVTTTGGTANIIPLFTTSTNIQNSILTQTGTTAVSVGGALDLPTLGTATKSKGYNSQPQDFVASVYSSTSKAAVAQTFQLQAEAVNNDKSTASGSLNLLYGSGTTTPAETGLSIANTGLITFAAGQTFPGTGDGTITGITTASGSGLSGGGTSGTLSLSIPAAGVTNAMLKDSSITLNASTAGGLTVPGAMTLGDTYTIGLKTCSANQVLEYVSSAWTCENAGTGTVTSVASGSGLTGGPITGSGTLSIATGGVTNAMLADSSLTVTAGTALTGGGSVSLGGTTTLNVDTTKVPLLSSANTFTAAQAVTGNLSSSGELSAGGVASGNTGSGTIEVDAGKLNTGAYGPGLLFAGGGEGIASNRNSGVNQYGLNFFTNYTARMAVTNSGLVAVGTSAPLVQFESIDVASTGTAVFGSSAVEGATAIWGDASNTSGTGWGVEGSTESSESGSYGVAGYANSTTGGPTGVYGYSSSSNGLGVRGASGDIGVNGYADGLSITGQENGYNAGVWGDSGGPSGEYSGVLGTADDNWAGWFVNNSDTYGTLYVYNAGAGGTGLVLQAHGNSGDCTMDTAGDVGCTGTVTSVVPADNGARKVSLYAMQAADNWFEDAGSGQLTSGSAIITLDPTFAQTVNTAAGYHVFLTPNGDCKGLYVSQKSATSFEVHELGGGNSSIGFDYRIMAKRSGFETVRLTDVTQQYQQMEKQQQLRQALKAQHQLARPKAKPTKGPIPAALLAKKGK